MRWRRFVCFLLDHRYELEGSRARTVMEWIKEDYDYYKVCSRCGDRAGVGEKYD